MTRLIGSQLPRVWSSPPYTSSLVEEAIDLCELAGLRLDEWQQFVLRWGLGQRDDGLWAAFEVGMNVARQNGKDAVFEARELVGLFLVPTDRLLIHTAHEFKTSSEHQRRLERLIQDTPEFHKRVKPRGYKHSHGEEGIELRDGKRIRFMTRTKGGGRGFSGDLVLYNEAMFADGRSIAALLPMLSARENPQLWYGGSAVDQQTNDSGMVFARLRERGHAGDDPRLAWFEWSAADESPATLSGADLADRERWAQANPALGIRISEEHLDSEMRAMGAREFAVERLGVGDWPQMLGEEQLGVLEGWEDLADPRATIMEGRAVAFDVSQDRSFATITLAGLRADGVPHVSLVERRRGTAWLAAGLAEACDEHQPAVVVCDGKGPAGSLLAELGKAGLEVTPVTTEEHVQACGQLFDLVTEQAMSHDGSEDLAAAVAGAARRPLGDAWAWSRRLSTVDISALVAATLAVWGVASALEPEPEPMVGFV